MSLDKILKFVAEKAQEIARTGTEVSPVFVFEDANEHGAVIMAPWTNAAERTTALAVLREILKQSSAVRYVTASEAWFVHMEEGEQQTCQPKDDPRRTSVLMVVGVEKGCKPVCEVYDIKDLNDDVRKRTLIRREDGYVGIGGALTELLDDDDEPNGRMQ